MEGNVRFREEGPTSSLEPNFRLNSYPHYFTPNYILQKKNLVLENTSQVRGGFFLYITYHKPFIFHSFPHNTYHKPFISPSLYT